MILECSDEGEYVGRAEEGVRVAELGVLRATVVGEVERGLVRDCRIIVREQARERSVEESSQGGPEAESEDGIAGDVEDIVNREDCAKLHGELDLADSDDEARLNGLVSPEQDEPLDGNRGA